MRGRPPKSEIEKLQSGDPGKRISAAAKSAFIKGDHPAAKRLKAAPFPAPKTLTTAALVVWKEVVGGHLTGTYVLTDKYQLAVYCEAVASFNRATAKIAEEGETAEGSKGQTVISPWVAIQEKAANKIDKIGATLFLTPVSREAMKTQAEAEPQEVNPFAGLIN